MRETLDLSFHGQQVAYLQAELCTVKFAFPI
jgi:hypothetical protein